MERFVIYDTEYLTREGAHARNWNGMDDPYPLTVQIAACAVEIVPEKGLSNVEEFSALINPRDEHRKEIPLDTYFVNLTGISQNDVSLKGKRLGEALDLFKSFSRGVLLYSYGRDHIFTLAPSCYIAGIPLPFGAGQFRDVRHVFRRAGVPEEAIYANSSGAIARYLGVDFTEKAHNALSDVRSVFEALCFLHSRGALKAEWLLE